MIEFIEGVLTAKSPSDAVVQVGGMGIRGAISLTTYDDLPATGQTIRLWTHLQLRDEELSLFAFSTQEERWLFQQLISVNGVGPKLAMVALSAAKPDVIRRAVAEGDSDRLKSIPRIGSKIAERIVLELKKKFSTSIPDFGAKVTTAGGDSAEAISALCALGFTRVEAEKAVDGAVKRGGKGVEELLRLALRAG
ncbi:Holliday junction branch migration protein RuvA [candidate division KSB1 bacterium]|nr:MAG: Holliday junction branch migration protein RuvA [candidate division KSB1 bacterium]